MDSERRVPRYESSPGPRQLVITERSVPEYIKGWLATGTRDVAFVAAAQVTSTVRHCVTMAREFEMPIKFNSPDIEEALLIRPAGASDTVRFLQELLAEEGASRTRLLALLQVLHRWYTDSWQVKSFPKVSPLTTS